MTTAQDYRDQAAAARQRSAESWERSDTDGFLSQWASDVSARVYDAKAELAEAGNVSEFQAVFTADGELTDFHQVKTQYGYSWVRGNSHDGTTEWFNDSNAKKGATRLRNDLKKGYQLGTIKCAAHVITVGSQTTCGPAIVPDTDADREVVSFGADSGWYEDREW